MELFVKQFMTWLTSPIRGSNRLSFWSRKRIEKLAVKQLLGINLAGLAFAVAVVVPQTGNIVSTWEISHETPPVTIIDGPTERETQWPLTQFGISQYFWVGHPGMDLTAPSGTPVYPIADGTVAWAYFTSMGYGNHVFVKSNNNLESLYAHFSKILVHTGDKVTKSTKIGEVGATGWATGNHVHLEVYQNGVPINPMDVLPEVK